MHTMLFPLAMAIGVGAMPTIALAQTPVASTADLKPYSVTVRRFDPAKGPASGDEFVLPVDSSDEEYAIASTIPPDVLGAIFGVPAETFKAIPTNRDRVVIASKHKATA